MTSSDFRQRAREALRGNWLIAILAGLIASLLGGVSSSGFSFNFDLPSEDMSDVEMERFLAQLGITEEILATIFAVLSVVFVIGMIYSIVMFIIGSSVAVGYSRFNLDLIDGYNANVGTLFSYFGIMKTAIVANLLRGLYVALWSMLFVIPGIIAAYSYSMTNFVLADNPDMTAKEAMKESKRIMKGNRWRLFCLELSFFGWALLCVLTLGVGYLWLVPYTQAAYAAFYREVKRDSDFIVYE